MLGICGLTVLGLVAGSIGTAGVLVGAVCALLPVGPVVAAFLWIDRWEPEPPRLLLLAFGWGACVAALTALLINTSAVSLLEQILGQGTGELAGPALVGPVVEEAVKGAFLVGLLVLHGREFDGVVDGVVYAGIVAAGFAFTENILYFGQAFVAEGLGGAGGGVLVTFLLRGVFAPFAHPLYTAMIGIGAGLAAGSRNAGFRVGAVVVGYLVAVALHALWNGSATLLGGAAFFDVYGYVMVPLFFAMSRLVVWQRRREQRTIAGHLPEFARQGWVAPSEVRAAGQHGRAAGVAAQGQGAAPAGRGPGGRPTTRRRSPSWRSCRRAWCAAPRARTPSSGAPRPSTRCTGPAGARWAGPRARPGRRLAWASPVGPDGAARAERGRTHAGAQRGGA